MNEIENPIVAEAFDRYPGPIRHQLMYLRQLVLDTATETEGVDQLEETLKWGEPSYLTKSGSTIRLESVKTRRICHVLQLQKQAG